ncbi:hypothetical protein DPMN_097682 [Dreissena polymorpha]|uniref:Uncharacterized protein n=1 Tax=Dreissena polymorpha TaxID=45954 RepID=A0A9D4R4S7_DREPO|nr:hypothetical protein DPMN_097682 [Dreissena polymorpha]
MHVLTKIVTDNSARLCPTINGVMNLMFKMLKMGKASPIWEAPSQTCMNGCRRQNLHRLILSSLISSAEHL